MAKHTELQTRKIISSYGGVGSIIETPEGALIIKEFDKWLYFCEINKGKIDYENEILEDERLLKRLQYYFPNLKNIIKVPANYSAIYNTSLPQIKENIINSEFFPKWFYCNKCGTFMHIENWYKEWQRTYKSKDKKNIDNSFIPPVCYKCYNNALKNKEKRKFYQLEQVRFILTAPNGEIKDIPWDLWTNITRPEKIDNEEDNQENQTSNITFNGKCCNQQDLEYLKDGKMSDLSGIRIKCKNPECQTKGKQKSLSGLFGLRLFCETIKDKDGNVVIDKKTGKEKKFCYKPVIRTSNSVYYPLIIHSLYLPPIELDRELKIKIKTLYEDAELSVSEIYDKLKSKFELTIQQIKEITNTENIDFQKENEYRKKEYLFLTTQKSPDNKHLSFETIISDDFQNLSILKVLKINTLKLTSVQTGYSRQEPIDKDLFAEYSIDDFVPASRHSVKAKLTFSGKRENLKIMPGIESFGEGIFLEFDSNKIISWIENNKENDFFKGRIETLKTNALQSDFHLTKERKEMIENYPEKFILLHTLSHILIKEFEFLVGYSATSIAERLYIDDEMQGILIYTIAGSEGSFGGLASQANTERLTKIFQSALTRAKDCASDPICYNSDGQGIGGLNLAACYSCTLLPETSCEEFNSFLDRALLIDNTNGYGFYKDNA
jgi:hypothetical protein